MNTSQSLAASTAEQAPATKSRTLWLALTFGAAVGGAAIGEQLLTSTLTEEPLRALIRQSGHISFFFFLVPMVAAPLFQNWPSQFTHWLLNHRTLFGLAFAGNHLWHLAGIIALYQISEESPEPVEVLIGGAFGMMYLLLMTLLSFPAIKQKCSNKAAGVVFKLAFYYLVSTFIYDIVIRNYPSPDLLLFSLLMMALTLRSYSWAVTRKTN